MIDGGGAAKDGREHDLDPDKNPYRSVFNGSFSQRDHKCGCRKERWLEGG